MIGLSLSFCIKMHLQDGMPLPDKIIAGTRCENREQFQSVIDSYSRVYWRKFPEEAAAIAFGFFDTGRLQQPRLSGEDHPGPYNGQWMIPDDQLNDFLTQQKGE
jgi:hypothetical protein